ncbi:uncharacterized protein LOC103524116 [Trichonephila clavipes]|uniref:Uncharacterized protein LOC103524116 n=1 Tax=Trichonephila clavipes TaxID=2585209 RepID=A0A8X6W3V9_TRICX|nr:uncharacterized protein LOC103524116 [Trichonephila clavipes]
MDEDCITEKVFNAQPIGPWRKGRPHLKWFDGIEKDILVLRTKNSSLLDFAQGAGIGVFSHLFSFYLHAGPLTTLFDDSTSALQALSNYNENNCLRVQNCRELLGKIKGKIVFQWVLFHCGLWGNERADFLAKKGTGILQNFRRDLTLHSAKLEIKRIFRESYRLTASRVARDALCKKSHGIPSSPRAAAVAKFRLLTGHDCLCAHLFRFNLVTSPICVLCDTGQDMTAAHLDECSALNDLNCIFCYIRTSIGYGNMVLCKRQSFRITTHAANNADGIVLHRVWQELDNRIEVCCATKVSLKDICKRFEIQKGIMNIPLFTKKKKKNEDGKKEEDRKNSIVNKSRTFS